jgi:hypothetical protein
MSQFCRHPSKYFHLFRKPFTITEKPCSFQKHSAGIWYRRPQLNLNLYHMKPILLLAFAATILLATSCGLGDKEKTAILQAQQAKDDSLRVAQIKQVKDQDALRSALRDSLSAYTILLDRQQSAMVQLRTTLYTANDDMTQIKAFHLGRLPKDREAQVKNQELKIQFLILEQSKLQTSIQHSTEEIAQLKSEMGRAQ